MNEYELTYILSVNVAQEDSGRIKDRITKLLGKHGGVPLREHDLGEKALAYPIRKEERGRYVRMHFLGNGVLVDDLEQQLRISAPVLRFLTVRVDRNVDPEAKKKEHAEVERKLEQERTAGVTEENPAASEEAASA